MMRSMITLLRNLLIHWGQLEGPLRPDTFDPVDGFQLLNPRTIPRTDNRSKPGYLLLNVESLSLKRFCHLIEIRPPFFVHHNQQVYFGHVKTPPIDMVT